MDPRGKRNMASHLDAPSEDHPASLLTSEPLGTKTDQRSPTPSSSQNLHAETNKKSCEKITEENQREELSSQVVNSSPEELLQLQEQEVAAKGNNSDETIMALQVSPLKSNLHLISEQLRAIQSLQSEEIEAMTVSLQEFSEQHSKMKSKLQKEKNLLKDQIEQFQQQLQEKDNEILRVRELNEDLVQRLSEATQQENTFSEEAETVEMWNATKELEEEKDHLYQIICKITAQLETTADKILENQKTQWMEELKEIEEEVKLEVKSWKRTIHLLEEKEEKEVTEELEELRQKEETPCLHRTLGDLADQLMATVENLLDNQEIWD